MASLEKPSQDEAVTSALQAALGILQAAKSELTATEIKKAMLADGLAKAEVDRLWPAVQKRIKADDRIELDRIRYRWVGELVLPSAAEALELLLNGDQPAAIKAALAGVIRSALSVQDSQREAEQASQRQEQQASQPAAKPENQPESQPDQQLDAARQRQAQIDAVRQLAELASEVEELVANETDAPVMIRQVRAWVKRSGLDPVGKAGEETRFDRKQHQPIVGRISDGAPVVVVRPGYVWKTQDEDVLLGKAVVEE